MNNKLRLRNFSVIKTFNTYCSLNDLMSSVTYYQVKNFVSLDTFYSL